MFKIKTVPVLIVCLSIISMVRLYAEDEATTFDLQEIASAQSNQLLWKIQNEKAHIYLFGSLHYGIADFYPFAESVESAFEKSDYLVVEINTVCETFMPEVAKHMRNGMLPPDRTLQTELSSEVFKLLENSLEELGVGIDRFSSYKPWLMALTLSGLKLQALGFDPGLGVESYFFSKSEEKSILELESVQSQMKSLSVLDSDGLLEYTLENNSELEKMMGDLTRAWVEGDSAALSAIILQDYSAAIPGYQEIYQALFSTRNTNMTNVLVDLLDTDGTYFVVVGAGHLLGPDSIIEMLIKRGREVTRVGE